MDWKTIDINSQFGYFDHDADIGIAGRGKTLESAFESAAYSMFALMTDLRKLPEDQMIQLSFQEESDDIALVRWLNGWLAEAQIARIVLHRFHLERKGDYWQGRAWGSAWTDTMARGLEVKGATLTALSVKRVHNQKWEARCVVDV